MTDAVETTITKLLMDRLLAFASAQSLQVAWPNLAFDPPAATYLKADLLWNRKNNIGIPDDSTTEHRGIFQVTVIASANSGIVSPTNVAGAIVSQFSRTASMSLGSLAVVVDSEPSLGPMPQAADRFRIPVSIPFYAFN